MMNNVIREEKCFALTGLSRSTRWRLEKKGKFPARIRISDNAIGWYEKEIEEWLKCREEQPSIIPAFIISSEERKKKMDRRHTFSILSDDEPDLQQKVIHLLEQQKIYIEERKKEIDAAISMIQEMKGHILTNPINQAEEEF